MTPQASSDDIRRCAREQLGIEALREAQEDAIRSTLEGRDTLVIQPTGSGKSAIYQIAGIMLPGATVVVSPLLALQRDQLNSIAAQRHGKRAAALNSTMPAATARAVLDELTSGELEYLFVAPEQLRKPELVNALSHAGISLFAVDEAHCVSEWGHDFRPDYLRLGEVIESLGHPVTLALTATASRAVRHEIVERLRMRNPAVLVSGFDRPNIHLRVDKFDSEEAKLSALAHRVRWAEKPGIVYVATRNNAESIMRALTEEGCRAEYYHAGLRTQDREAIQQRFMSGETEVIVATNAFGMGIDKADVRFVYHYDLPESLDAYYQEVGRAGRDGNPAEAVLFYRAQNAGVRKFQAGGGKFLPSEVEQVLRSLPRGGIDPASAATSGGLGPAKTQTMLQYLVDAGAVEYQDGRLRRRRGLKIQKAAESVVKSREVFLERRKERLRQMQGYAAVSTCRREFLLRYFDDEWGACVNCDNCASFAGQFLPAELSGGTRREVA